MKIMITGGSGFLGQFLNLQLSTKHEIFTLYRNNPGNCINYRSAKIDLIYPDQLNELFENFKPDILIHTAGITQPGTNEPSKLVYKTNVTATEKIAQLCSRFNCKIIYTSTDLVYAGYRGSMLNEDAKLIPASLYAETKLMGEEKIKEHTKNYLILRTALLFGIGLNHSTNYFQKMYDDLKNNREVKLFTDQFRTPLAVNDAANLINQLCSLIISEEVVNFGGNERLSRYELGEKLCEFAGFSKDLLIPIKMSDLPGYPAVEDVSMNTTKLKSLGLKQKSLIESFAGIFNN